MFAPSILLSHLLGGIVCCMAIAAVLGQEIISSCLSMLDQVGKAKYFTKILLASVTAKEDSYKFKKKWRISGHIFCYFVERPGTFTIKPLLQWKSIEAYTFFQNGHVRDMLHTCIAVHWDPAFSHEWKQSCKHWFFFSVIFPRVLSGH